MLTNEEFQEKLKSKNKDIYTNTYYKGNDTVMDCVCVLGHAFKSKAFNLIYNNSKCPVCSGRQVCVGYNDLWTTNPQFARLLKNPEDGYKYSQGSGQKVEWICPNCGEVMTKLIHNVCKRGLCCNKCSDGISFPNRFMYNMLKQLNIEFISEYIIDGKKYRYDFYIPRFNMIIEMHGKQHYYGWNNKRITKEEIQRNDANKKEYALSNNIDKYIEIDCREGNKEHISKSIINSELSKIFNLKNVDWNLCCLDSINSFVKLSADLYNIDLSTTEISNKLGFSTGTIIRWLKLATELKFCNWIPSKGFLNDERPVICLNNLAVYKSISEASRETNQNLQNISGVCSGNRNYCGTIDDKPMVWMYLDEYNNSKIENKSLEVHLSHHNSISVNQYTIDGTYIKTFKSINKAKEETGVTTIINVCNKKKFDAGGYRWYYIDDKNQPDISKIHGIPRDYGSDSLYIKQQISKQFSIDCYDRYGNYIKTYDDYKHAESETNCSHDQIYKCCTGRATYSGDYVFRYTGDDFNKYFYPKEFCNYINIYKKDDDKYIGTYYSLQEAYRQLNFSGVSSAYKALRKERKYAYGYRFFYASDPEQPDKTKIIA